MGQLATNTHAQATETRSRLSSPKHADVLHPSGSASSGATASSCAVSASSSARQSDASSAAVPLDRDAALARAVAYALSCDVFVPQGRVEPRVENGWVTLEGSVDYCSQLKLVEAVTSEVAGVSGVTSCLRVEPPPPIAPAEVWQAIEAALEACAQLEAQGIRVSIEQGRFVISGVTRCAQHKHAAIAAATAMLGARSVEDRLLVAR